MKDIPVFTTEYGAASLILKEIPYRKESYIRVHAVQPGHLKDLLKECAAFCRMAGAEKVFAAGHKELESYPLHCVIYEMRGIVETEPCHQRDLFPVTEETVGDWRRICNERLAQVDCAATQTAQDEKTILASGGAYFIHDRGELLGVGWLSGGELLLLAAVKPGAGEQVARTLLSLVPGQSVKLEVASGNRRAIRLYEKLGFFKTGEKIRWYAV